MKKTFSEESFTSSQNSPGNDENMWDKMASCPTFSEEGVRRTDAFWANEMGCLPEDLYKTGVGITVRGASDGRYAHVFRRLERLQVDCSPSLYGDLRSAIKVRGTEELFEPAFWRATLGARVERIVGPTCLSYKDVAEERPIDPCVRILGVDEGSLLDHLRR